jgi:hypothetical protein
MLAQYQKSTGTDYTSTVALLVFGIVFVPALLIAASPIHAVLAASGTILSMSCLALAWFGWERTSELSIPTIFTHRRDIR